MEHSKITSAHVALIGGGRWGKNLLRAFHATGALRWVCDASDAVLSQLQNKYSDLQFTQHFEEVMSDPQVTAVVIATPAFTHPELVRVCLEAGKDVFVEKPLAFDTHTALSLTLLAEEKNRILMTGHLLQYHPVFLELLRTVHQGEFGALHFINSNRLSPGPIRHEENALWNFAPHDVSMILALHKQTLPAHVRAIGGCHVTPGIVDNCHVILQFEEGGHAVIHNSWLHPYKEHKLSVVGERGMAVFDDTKSWTEKLEIQQEFMSVDEWQRPQLQECTRRLVDIETREPLSEECLHFLMCCSKRCQPRTNGWEALKVTAVIEAAQKSLEQGGELVDVCLPSADYFLQESQK